MTESQGNPRPAGSSIDRQLAVAAILVSVVVGAGTLYLQGKQSSIEEKLAQLEIARNLPNITIDAVLTVAVYPNEAAAAPCDVQALVTVVNRGLQASAIRTIRLVLTDRTGHHLRAWETPFDAEDYHVDNRFPWKPPRYVLPPFTDVIAPGAQKTFLVDVGEGLWWKNYTSMDLQVFPVLGNPSPHYIDPEYFGVIGGRTTLEPPAKSNSC